MHSRRLASTLVLAAALGCSHGVRVQTHPGPELKAQAAAVFPVQLRWDEPDFRAFELSYLLVQEIVATDRYAVFGPGEFRLVQASANDPFVGSDLVLDLGERGLSSVNAVVFKPWVEKRSQSALKQVYDLKGRPRAIERTEQATLVAHLEVYYSATREVLVELESAVEMDPLAAREASDPTPELTEALTSIVRRALAELKDRAPGDRVRRSPGFAFAWNPKAVFDFAQDGHAPLKDQLEKLDALEQNVLIETRLRFFYPDPKPALLARLKRMGPGLLVTEVDAEAAERGLKDGDLVVGVGRDPALPQALHRALRAARPGTPVDLKVQRGRDSVVLSVLAR